MNYRFDWYTPSSRNTELNLHQLRKAPGNTRGLFRWAEGQDHAYGKDLCTGPSGYISAIVAD